MINCFQKCVWVVVWGGRGEENPRPLRVKYCSTPNVQIKYAPMRRAEQQRSRRDTIFVKTAVHTRTRLTTDFRLHFVKKMPIVDGFNTTIKSRCLFVFLSLVLLSRGLRLPLYSTSKIKYLFMFLYTYGNRCTCTCISISRRTAPVTCTRVLHNYTSTYIMPM